MPYQTQPLFEDAISTGTLGAVNGVVTLTLNNSSGAIVNISGTWVGTIIFEGTNDKFVTVQNAAVFTPPAGVITAGVTTNAYYRFVAVSGFTQIRARMSAHTSGTATIVLSASIGSGLAPTVSINYDSMLGTSKLTGNTDGTKIGNTNDRLKVDATISSVSAGTVATISSDIKADIIKQDINIISISTYDTVYTYSGTGLLIGFNVEFNNVNIVVKLVIDGKTVFDGWSLSDLNSFLVTADAQYRRQSGSGILTQSSSLDWSLKHPIGFSSNVTISARLSGSPLVSRKFQQGIFYIVKVT